jgi:hypothetical protein
MGRGAATGATGAGEADDDDDEVGVHHSTLNLPPSLHSSFSLLISFFLSLSLSLSLSLPLSRFLRQDEAKKEDSWKLKLPDPNRSRDYRNGGTLRDYQIEGNDPSLHFPNLYTSSFGLRTSLVLLTTLQ